MSMEVELRYINDGFVLFPENKLWMEFEISEEEPLGLELVEFPMLDLDGEF